MIINRIVKETYGKLSPEEILKNTERLNEEDKNKILHYLKSFSVYGYTSPPLVDKIANIVIDEDDANNLYTDGVYTWFALDVIYFEKYNITLKKEFKEYVLNKS